MKFWANTAARTIVHVGARRWHEALGALRARPRRDPTAARGGRTPCVGGARANVADDLGGAGEREVRVRRRGTAASTPSTAAGHVARSCQSNGGVPVREPMRTAWPAAARRAATRRPVLPVPPVTRIGAGSWWWSWRRLNRGSAERVHGSSRLENMRDRLRSRDGRPRRPARRTSRPRRLPDAHRDGPAVVACASQDEAPLSRGRRAAGTAWIVPDDGDAGPAGGRRRRRDPRPRAVHVRRRSGHATAGDHPPRPALHDARRRRAAPGDGPRRAVVGQRPGTARDVQLVGTYQLDGEVGARLLDALPAAARRARPTSCSRRSSSCSPPRWPATSRARRPCSTACSTSC